MEKLTLLNCAYFRPPIFGAHLFHSSPHPSFSTILRYTLGDANNRYRQNFKCFFFLYKVETNPKTIKICPIFTLSNQKCSLITFFSIITTQFKEQLRVSWRGQGRKTHVTLRQEVTCQRTASGICLMIRLEDERANISPAAPKQTLANW